MKPVIILFTILFVPAVAFPDTIHVPKDHAKIQDAIDAAKNGDTVLVAPGTYTENIDFKGKAVTVTSSGGPEVTAIDGGSPANPDYGSVVIFQSQEGPDSILEGFTLTNGTGTLYSTFRRGGGIYCFWASPSVLGNIIEENSAFYGGGFFGDLSDPMIENNLVTNNDGDGLFFRYGSPGISGNTVSANDGDGIKFEVDSNPLISGNIVKWNKGDGISFREGCDPNITGNTIVENEDNGIRGAVLCSSIIAGNVVRKNGYGGIFIEMNCTAEITGNIVAENCNGSGIYCYHGSPSTITNNVVYDNVTTGMGGGICCINDSDCIFTNNTVFNNQAGNYGGGIACYECDPEITNTILWGNSAATGPELYGGYANINIDYSDVEGGKSSAFIHKYSTLNWGTSMIDADPLFVDPAGEDFHILHHSPCRDWGSNSAPGIPSEDFEGDPRITYGIADVGADEFHTRLYFTGDFIPGGSVDAKLVGLPGTAPVGLCFGSGVLDPPLPSIWGDWHLKFPIIGPIDLGAIPSPGGVLILSGFIPATPPGPYEVPGQALIGSELTNLFLLEVE